jgi:hypothetical protein
MACRQRFPLKGYPVNTSPPSTESRALVRVALAVIALGCILRLWQLAAGASLWLDELAVVRNIVYLPLRTLLLSPLEYGQMAPSGFLAVGRMLFTAIPDQDWVFRVVPFISAVATLPFVYLMSRRALGGLPAVVATALIALSPPLIGFGAVAKQYASDVFVAAVLMYGGLRILSGEMESPRRLVIFGLVGGLLLFFSFPGVLVAFALATSISAYWAAEQRPEWIRKVVGLGLPLGVCAAAATGLALRTRSQDTASYMADYWTAGFPQSLGNGPFWLWRRLVVVYEAAFITPYPWTGVQVLWPSLLLGLALIGAAALLVQNRATATIVLAPLVVAIAAAAVQLYPLGGRVSLFLTPTLAVLTVAGGVALGQAVNRIVRGAAPFVHVVPLAPVAAGLLAAPPPYVVEHTRPLFQTVAEEWRPSDGLYSYYAANQATDYYGTRYGITNWQAGVCARGNPREYLRQVDTFRGVGRVWVVFTHALPSLAEREAILGYLRAIGSQERALLDQLDDLGTSAYLFDLSDPEKLARTTAGEYELDSNVFVNPAFRCGRGPASEWEPPRIDSRTPPMGNE